MTQEVARHSASTVLPALAQQIADLKGHYATAYRALHRELNRSLTAYRRDFDAAKLKLHALELLNNILDLGQPTGVGLAQSLAGLGMCLTPRNVSTISIDLGEAPQYTNCGLTLEQSLDTDGLARLVAEIDAALDEKNRMLSNLLVDNILQSQVTNVWRLS
jgi:hypothetical protein